MQFLYQESAIYFLHYQSIKIVFVSKHKLFEKRDSVPFKRHIRKSIELEEINVYVIDLFPFELIESEEFSLPLF